MTEEELSRLIGPSLQPSQDFIDFSKGGASSPEKAMKKMRNRESIKFMLNLMQRQSAQSVNPYRDKDPLPLEMMEQRNIDPREYGAPLPPNAPQVSKYKSDRLNPHETKMRWLDQLIDHVKRSIKNIDSGAPTAPPQLTGRSRNRIAF